MAASDARPVPRKATAFRLYVLFYDADGNKVTGWTGAAGSISKDGSSFASTANAPAEIGSSGHGYIEFTAAEMNADGVVVELTITNEGARPRSFALYPEESGDYRVEKTGYALSSDGIDLINADTGINARAALGKILAAAAGQIAGANSGTVTIYTAASNGGTPAIVASVDQHGNRTSVNLNP